MSQPQRNPVPTTPSQPVSEAPSESLSTGVGSADAVRWDSEFSVDERLLLLRAAHDSILSTLEGREPALDAPNPHLAKPRGVFTSIYLREARRGCVGYVMPTASVYRNVVETARAAAFDDNRFRPVTLEEASDISVELSILSPPAPVSVQEIRIGRHGLLVNMSGRRGLLLPQVPVEHGWDVETFLNETCRKAGLPRDAWQRGALIEAFTAEIFSDKKFLAQQTSE